MLAGDLQLLSQPLGARDRVAPECELDDPQARLLVAALVGGALLEQGQDAVALAGRARDLLVGAKAADPRQDGVRLALERVDRARQIALFELVIGVDGRNDVFERQLADRVV